MQTAGVVELEVATAVKDTLLHRDARWHQILHHFVARSGRKRFFFSVADCCKFASDDDETGERFNIPESILSAEEFVRKEARKHTLPTGGAGARHMSAEHKLNTQWHMIRLQVRRLILPVLIYLLCN